MPRRGLLLAAILLFIAAAMALAHRYVRWPRKTGPRHNVVLITLDTTRADHLGCYGYPEPVSPRIDALASEGALFINAYATASVTPVSHASILTGQYPYTHGLRVMHGLTENRLPDSAVTLAETLRDAGYQTAAFVSAFPAGSRFGLDQGFDTFDESFVEEPIERIVAPSGTINTGKNQRRGGETTDLALKWLAGVSEPFFVWLHYFDPHDIKVLPPAEFMMQFPVPTGEDAEQLRYVYDLEILYMDEQIGRVLDALEETGRRDDTVVVVVSDHGQGLGDHDWWTHGILYEEQIKAPLMIRAPNVPAGQRVQHLVRTVDVMPTIIDLVGLDIVPDAPLDGASLVPVLKGGSPGPGYLAYADSVNMLNYVSEPGFLDAKTDMLFAVTDGRWKYIHHLIREDESELYDLVDDPRELRNLYVEAPADLARLRRDLNARPFQPRSKQGERHMSPSDLERLRSLGYLR